MAQHLNLVTDINGKKVDREAVLAWELGRLKKVLSFLGAPAAHAERGVDELRRQLLDLKRSIGPQELQRRLATRLRISNGISTFAARVSMGNRVQSSIKISVPSGTAERFAEWFNAESALPYSDAMLAACPDHYFIGEDDLGRSKVVETTGGSPLPSEFFIDYKDISSLKTPASPDYPIQIAGVARTSGGLAIGGVRHQFRNFPEGGFESWNTVEFPNTVGGWMVRGHQWHLACEFGNWIEFQQLGLK